MSIVNAYVIWKQTPPDNAVGEAASRQRFKSSHLYFLQEVAKTLQGVLTSTRKCKFPPTRCWYLAKSFCFASLNWHTHYNMYVDRNKICLILAAYLKMCMVFTIIYAIFEGSIRFVLMNLRFLSVCNWLHNTTLHIPSFKWRLGLKPKRYARYGIDLWNRLVEIIEDSRLCTALFEFSANS